jgi:hypothetical protein
VRLISILKDIAVISGTAVLELGDHVANSSTSAAEKVRLKLLVVPGACPARAKQRARREGSDLFVHKLAVADEANVLPSSRAGCSRL